MVVQHGRIGPHRLVQGHHRRQHLVLDLYQGQRRLGDVRIIGSHRRDRMADPEHFVFRHIHAGDVPHVGPALADLGFRIDGQIEEVLTRDRGTNPLQCKRLRNIDANETGMRVRAALDASMQHARQ